jgi:large subunit ribosomal protein L31
MRPEIHPDYVDATVHCACGATWQTKSTRENIHVEVCSTCHPYYTGRQKLMDTAGRVERFRQKWGDRRGREQQPAESAAAETAAE